jgi:hypothetical protein
MAVDQPVTAVYLIMQGTVKVHVFRRARKKAGAGDSRTGKWWER